MAEEISLLMQHSLTPQSTDQSQHSTFNTVDHEPKVNSSDDELKIKIGQIHNAIDEGDVQLFSKALEAIPVEDVVRCDFYENLTLLHRACRYPNKLKAREMTEKILSYEDGIIFKNLVNKKTNDDASLTALHIAAKMYNQELTTLLVDNVADFNIKCGQGEQPIHLIYKYSPDVVINWLDEGIENNNSKINSDYSRSIFMEFGCVIGLHGDGDDKTKYLIETELLADALGEVSGEVRSQVLGHPLVQLFLEEKRNRMIGYIRFLAGLDMIWSLTYIALATWLYYIQCFNRKGIWIYCEHFGGNMNWILLFFHSFLTLLSLVEKVWTVSKIPKTRRYTKYFFVDNAQVLHWVFMFINFISLGRATYCVLNSEIYIFWLEYSLASFGILLGCWVILKQIKKLRWSKTWLNLLLKVSWKITKALFSHVLLFVGFSMAFQLLMPEIDEFNLFKNGNGFFKVITMMTTGEIEYHDLLGGNETKISVPSPTTTKLLFLVMQTVLMLSFMGIALGVAIFNCQKQLEEADYITDGNTLEQLYLLEKFLMSIFKDHGGKPFRKFIKPILLATEVDCKAIKIEKKFDEIPKRLKKSVKAILNKVTEIDVEGSKITCKKDSDE